MKVSRVVLFVLLFFFMAMTTMTQDQELRPWVIFTDDGQNIIAWNLETLQTETLLDESAPVNQAHYVPGIGIVYVGTCLNNEGLPEYGICLGDNLITKLIGTFDESGGRIVAVRVISETARFELVLVDLVSGRSATIALADIGSRVYHSVHWSPFGDAFLISATGNQTTIITTYGFHATLENCAAGVWYSGDEIACRRDNQIVVWNLVTREMTPLYEGQIVSTSPNGQIAVINGLTMTVYNGDESMVVSEHAYWAPVWDPSGEYLAYPSLIDGHTAVCVWTRTRNINWCIYVAATYFPGDLTFSWNDPHED